MRAKCAFPGCNSAIIEVTDSRIAHLPAHAVDTLQIMQRKDSSDDRFVIVEDVWDFDNIGVSKELPLAPTDEISFDWNSTSHTVTRCIKYLVCADCDRGPIGVLAQTTEGRQLYILSLASTVTDYP